MRNFVIAIAFVLSFGMFSSVANAGEPCNASHLAASGIPAVPFGSNVSVMPTIGFGSDAGFYSFGTSVKAWGAELGFAAAKCHDPADFTVDGESYTEDVGVSTGFGVTPSPNTRVGLNLSKPGFDTDFEDVAVRASFRYSF